MNLLGYLFFAVFVGLVLYVVCKIILDPVEGPVKESVKESTKESTKELEIPLENTLETTEKECCEGECDCSKEDDAINSATKLYEDAVPELKPELKPELEAGLKDLKESDLVDAPEDYLKYVQPKKENIMTITDFQSKIAKEEGKKKETSIGNVRETIKLVNLNISKIKKEDLECIVKNYKGKDLLYKIIRKL